jgi:hypothetical protein
MDGFCNFCAVFSGIGVVFYFILAIMCVRQNIVVLTHKMGLEREFVWVPQEN